MWPGYADARPRCSCDELGMCERCERAAEEAEADDRIEAHARAPEPDDFDAGPCESCGGQGAGPLVMVCCGNWRMGRDGSAECCNAPVAEPDGYCGDCGGSGWVQYEPVPHAL